MGEERSAEGDECCEDDSVDVEGDGDAGEGGEGEGGEFKDSSDTAAPASKRIGLGVPGGESGGDDVAEAGAAAEAGTRGVRGAGAGASTSGKEGEPNTDVASSDPRREPAGDQGQALVLLPTPAPAPAPGDAGKGSSTADDESLVPGRDDKELLRWRTRSRSEGRALSLGRSPGCMHDCRCASTAIASADALQTCCCVDVAWKTTA